MYLYELEIYCNRYNGEAIYNKTLGMFTGLNKAVDFAKYWQGREVKFNQANDWSILNGHSREHESYLMPDPSNGQHRIKYVITQYKANPNY